MATNSPLRIMMVVDNVYPVLGGAEIQVGTLCRGLAALGHAVEILCYRRDGTALQREVVDGIAVKRISYPRIRILGSAVLYFKFALHLLRHRNAYDAIHINAAENMAAVVGLLKPLLKVRAVVKISGAAEFDGGWLDPQAKRQWINRLRAAMFKRLDAVQALSRYTVDRLQAVGYPAQAIHLIPNAVDTGRFSPSAPEQRPGGRVAWVVYVGRLETVKGVDVLLQAWKLMASRRSARLLILGTGSEQAALEYLAQKLDIDSEVRFVGNVPNPASWLQQADVYVQPSRQEGLSNAVLEALSTGLPVVATRVSGDVELVQEGVNGYLVPTENPPALAQALDQLLALGPERMRQMGQASRQIAESRFGVASVAQRLERLYISTPKAGD